MTAGYIGGSDKNPTYETYAASGYVESVEILYDPTKISYSQLLDIFWEQLDSLDPEDRGPQYRSIIFYQNPGQKRLAESSQAVLKKTGRYSNSITTEILPATEFHEAEAEYQNFHFQNPLKSKLHPKRSGSND